MSIFLISIFIITMVCWTRLVLFDIHVHCNILVQFGPVVCFRWGDWASTKWASFQLYCGENKLIWCSLIMPIKIICLTYLFYFYFWWYSNIQRYPEWGLVMSTVRDNDKSDNSFRCVLSFYYKGMVRLSEGKMVMNE